MSKCNYLLFLILQLDCKKNNIKFNRMHPTGFEPVTFQRKTDYESGAFDHSATNANMELMGFEPTSIQNCLMYSFTGIVSKNKIIEFN